MACLRLANYYINQSIAHCELEATFFFAICPGLLGYTTSGPARSV